MQGIAEQIVDRADARDASPFRQAVALQDHLRTFDYDEDVALAHNIDDIESFLVDIKRGYCEQFATAMAVMARTLGLPSRVAIGFAVGTTGARPDEYEVSSRHAHAWVEIWMSGFGWVTFEPTPRGDALLVPRYTTPAAASPNPETSPTPSAAESPEASPTASAGDTGTVRRERVERLGGVRCKAPRPGRHPSRRAPGGRALRPSDRGALPAGRSLPPGGDGARQGIGSLSRLPRLVRHDRTRPGTRRDTDRACPAPGKGFLGCRLDARRSRPHRHGRGLRSRQRDRPHRRCEALPRCPAFDREGLASPNEIARPDRMGMVADRSGKRRDAVEPAAGGSDRSVARAGQADVRLRCRRLGVVSSSSSCSTARSVRTNWSRSRRNSDTPVPTSPASWSIATKNAI